MGSHPVRTPQSILVHPKPTKPESACVSVRLKGINQNTSVPATVLTLLAIKPNAHRATLVPFAPPAVRLDCPVPLGRHLCPCALSMSSWPREVSALPTTGYMAVQRCSPRRAHGIVLFPSSRVLFSPFR